MWCGVSYIRIGSITSDSRIALATGPKDNENKKWQGAALLTHVNPSAVLLPMG